MDVGLLRIRVALEEAKAVESLSEPLQNHLDGLTVDDVHTEVQKS